MSLLCFSARSTYADFLGKSLRHISRSALHNSFGLFSEPNFEIEFDHFLRGREGILPGQPTIRAAGLTADQLEGKDYSIRHRLYFI